MDHIADYIGWALLALGTFGHSAILPARQEGENESDRASDNNRPK
jgi:hypothetical protein